MTPKGSGNFSMRPAPRGSPDSSELPTPGHVHYLGSSHLGTIKAASHLHALRSRISDNPVDRGSGPQVQPPWVLPRGWQQWGRRAPGPYTGMESGPGKYSQTRLIQSRRVWGWRESCHLGNKGRTGVAWVRGCICSHTEQETGPIMDRVGQTSPALSSSPSLSIDPGQGAGGAWL